MSESTINNEHSVVVNDRCSILITGIKSIDSFDETLITGTTVNGNMINIEGTELTVKDINLDKGKVEAYGRINGFFYVEDSPSEKRGIFSIFNRR